MPLPVRQPLRAALLAAAVCSALPAAAQMPSPKEMEEAMRKMREQMDKLTPEQRKMLEQTQRQLAAQPTVGSGDDVGVPRRDAARIAKVPRAPLTGAQLKAHVEALQPKLAQALSAAARRRAQAIERALQQQGGDVAAKLAATANGLAAWGAWPEATYLMGKAALASGSAQDLNNLAALLTMQKAGHAALPILITLDARYPNNATILNNLGQAWFELGELKEAERALRLALARAPNHPQANVTQSHIEEARGDRAAAQASMRRAIAGGYSEGKERRLNRLGGRLAPGELRWTMKLPADALGLSKFTVLPYPRSLGELPAAAKAWEAFREHVGAAYAKVEAQTEMVPEKTDAAKSETLTSWRCLMKAGPDRKYTEEFRRQAVRQVLDGGHSVPQVARALEMSAKKLANRVARVKRGQPLPKRPRAQPADDLQAECTRLRQENARLKLEREILKEAAAAYFAKESM